MFDNTGLKNLIGESEDIRPFRNINDYVTRLRQFDRMNNPWYIDLNENLPIPIDIQYGRRWFRNYTYYYMNDLVRIEFGYHFSESGKSYWLQHKINGKWVMKKRTYGETHADNLMSIIRYLVE